MSNDMRYRLQAKGAFSPSVLKAFSTHPKAKEYNKFKAYRDKEVERRTVGNLEDMKEKLTKEELKHVNKTDQVKHYGENDEYKQQTQQAGKVFDSKGSQIYPDMEGYSKKLIQAKEEGYGTSMEITDTAKGPSKERKPIKEYVYIKRSRK